MKVKKYIIVWFKTVLLGSLLATVLSIPIILIKMEYHLMSTISIIIPFIVITIIVSLITSIPTIAVMICDEFENANWLPNPLAWWHYYIYNNRICI